MDNNYITKFIVTKEPNIQKYFRGISNLETFYDEASSKINRNENNIFIFNSVSDQKYGHWLLFMTCAANEKAFFMDSFAKHPTYYDPDLGDFLESLSPLEKFDTLPYAVQSKNRSETCGLWVILFASIFAKNPEKFAIALVTKAFHFSKDYPKLNDQKLMSYFSKRYLVSKDKLLNAQRYAGNQQRSISYRALKNKTQIA